MNYKNLLLMLSKTNTCIKIMNAFHPWDGGFASLNRTFHLMKISVPLHS